MMNLLHDQVKVDEGLRLLKARGSQEWAESCSTPIILECFCAILKGERIGEVGDFNLPFPDKELTKNYIYNRFHDLLIRR